MLHLLHVVALIVVGTCRASLKNAIMEHNDRFERGEISWKASLNDMVSLTKQEYRKYLGYSKRQAHLYSQHTSKNYVPIDASDGMSITIQTRDGPKKVYLNTPVEDLPEAVDWRLSGFVTPVKNQAGCGSCYAFASVEALEYYVNSNSDRFMTLSPQQITECVVNTDECGGTGGCGGGIAELVYDYVIDHSFGVTDAQWMPYVSGTNITCVGEDPSQIKFTCKEARTGIVDYRGQNITSPRMYGNITGYTSLPTNDYQTLMNAVAKIGPVVVNIDASNAADPNNHMQDAFSAYSGGVFDGCALKYNTNSTDINHVVTLDGYGVDPVHGPYWLIRNSWKASYGEGGYIRLRRQANDSLLCDWDQTPDDGYTCAKPDPTPPQKVCGPCGLLSRAVIPLGANFLNAEDSSGIYTDPALIGKCPSSGSTTISSGDGAEEEDNGYFLATVVLAILLALTMTALVYVGSLLKAANSAASIAPPKRSTSTVEGTSNPMALRPVSSKRDDDKIPKAENDL